MQQYLVHFVDETPSFLCFADDTAHAIEQAENAYPDSAVYSVFLTVLVYHTADDTLRSFVRQTREIVQDHLSSDPEENCTITKQLSNLFEEYDKRPGKMP